MASNLKDLALYVAQHTAVLPAMLAYSMASHTSLKTYLAVQAVEDAPPVSDDDRKRLGRCRKFLGFFTVVAILTVEFWLIGQQDEKALDVFFRVLFGFIYQAALTGTLVDVTKAFSWVAYRSPGRMLHFRPARDTVKFSHVLLSVLTATGLNVAAYFDYTPLAGSFLTVALLYRTLSQAHRRSFSIRVMSFCLLAWLALTFILSGALVMYLVKAYKEDGDGNLVDDAGNVVLPADAEEVAFASSAVMQYIHLMWPFAFAFGPGLLIAGCYRFDYANHVEENPAPAQAVTLRSIDAPTKFARFLSRGVIVPQEGPTHFYRPYFATALRSWFLAQLITFGMFAMALPVPKDALESSAFDLLALALAIPLMIVGLGVTATVRGEFRKLWRYKEVWTPKEGAAAEGGVVLEDGPVEEQLPAYAGVAAIEADEKKALLSEVVVVEEVAPAYEVPHKV